MNWRRHAACVGEDPELFFPVGESAAALAQLEEAKAVCRRCPMIDTCLAWALQTRQDSGVWGGQSEGERRRLNRSAARIRRRVG